MPSRVRIPFRNDYTDIQSERFEKSAEHSSELATPIAEVRSSVVIFHSFRFLSFKIFFVAIIALIAICITFTDFTFTRYTLYRVQFVLPETELLAIILTSN